MNPDPDAQDSAIDRVAQEVYSRLHSLISDRLFHDKLNEWGVAYSHRGLGSTWTRARDIQDIYETAAPVPGETPVPETIEFLDVIRELFKEAAEAAGAKIIS